MLLLHLHPFLQNTPTHFFHLFTVPLSVPCLLHGDLGRGGHIKSFHVILPVNSSYFTHSHYIYFTNHIFWFWNNLLHPHHLPHVASFHHHLTFPVLGNLVVFELGIKTDLLIICVYLLCFVFLLIFPLSLFFLFF